jgi:hypothetical protein
MQFKLIELAYSPFMLIEPDSRVPLNVTITEEDSSVTLEWTEENGHGYTYNFDGDQPVRADGDFFTITDWNGEDLTFAAMRTVRLNDLPELR